MGKVRRVSTGIDSEWDIGKIAHGNILKVEHAQ